MAVFARRENFFFFALLLGTYNGEWSCSYTCFVTCTVGFLYRTEATTLEITQHTTLRNVVPVLISYSRDYVLYASLLLNQIKVLRL